MEILLKGQYLSCEKKVSKKGQEYYSLALLFGVVPVSVYSKENVSFKPNQALEAKFRLVSGRFQRPELYFEGIL